MVHEVILPKLGQTMEEGTIVEWLKQEGDPVQRGEVLFMVETDKATLEVEATARGFLRKILVPTGQTVSVLTVVALITRTADEDISAYEPRFQVPGSRSPRLWNLRPSSLKPVVSSPRPGRGKWRGRKTSGVLRQATTTYWGSSSPGRYASSPT